MIPRTTAPSIVVIEDNPDNMRILIELLEDEVGVSFCEGRASGWQMFRLLRSLPDQPVDLVLLDLQIPGEDGFGVLRQIRENGRLRSVCVVAVTANVMPQDVMSCRAAGFDGFIGKPLDAQRFPGQIRRVLAGEPVWEPR